MQEKPQKKVRCAVYCRKSVEDSEEKEFNSIDAQREAGENFIASQKGNGWVCLNKHYDDYGFSGGNMNRPALKELIADCKSELVDIVVVYKVDRLSRSIVDFGELSKDFDKWNVSFVSVTQEINTSRKLLTKAGEVELKIPRLRTLPFETQIIERYKTKQSSVEEALIEMYLAGVSVRRVEDIIPISNIGSINFMAFEARIRSINP